jgi:hypothetical protein
MSAIVRVTPDAGLFNIGALLGAITPKKTSETINHLSLYMQRSVFNCATTRVANTTDMSGRATADEINRGLRPAKGSKLWRIACSTFLGSLMVAGLIIALAPLPARADHDEDSRHGDEDNHKGIRAEITALQAQLASLESTVSKLQTANADQQNEIKSLQTSNAKSDCSVLEKLSLPLVKHRRVDVVLVAQSRDSIPGKSPQPLANPRGSGLHL